MQLCSKPRGARGIEPETFRRRGQLLSCPPTAGPLCCPVPARPCPGPCVPLAHEVAVFGCCHSVPAWCAVCSVHPPASDGICVGFRLPAWSSVHAWMLRLRTGPDFARSACLRLVLFCTCPPLCVAALWPMPTWVWCVRSVFTLFLLRIYGTHLVYDEVKLRKHLKRGPFIFLLRDGTSGIASV